MSGDWREGHGGDGDEPGNRPRAPYRLRFRRRQGRLPSYPELVGGLLDRLLERRHLSAPLRIFRLQAAWRELVGEVAAARSFPIALEKDRLVVGVADSTWLQELTFLKSAILQKVRSLLGPGVVGAIQLRVQPGAHTPEELRPKPVSPEVVDPEEELRRRPLAPAVAEALSRFEDDLERVSNPDLRRSIRRAYIRHLLRQP